MIRRGSAPPGHVRILLDGVTSALVAAGRSHPHETGGILLGWREPETLAVARALEVPDIGATPHRYRRHHAAAETALASALASEPRDSPLGYIGEWHIHAGHQPPSWQDRREIAAISRISLSPVTLIVVAGRPGAWTTFALNGLGGRVCRAVIANEEP